MSKAFAIISRLKYNDGKIAFRMPAISLVVIVNNEISVFDTGMFDDELYVKKFKRTGINPDNVNYVFNTHLHPDHFGNTYLFKDALKYFSRDEYSYQERWVKNILEKRDPNLVKDIKFRHFENSSLNKRFNFFLDICEKYWDPNYIKNLKEVKWYEDKPYIPSYIEPFLSSGHTPFHRSFIIKGDKTKILFTGDALTMKDLFYSRELPENEPVTDLKNFQKSLKEIRKFKGIVVPGHYSPFYSDTAKDILRYTFEF